MLKGKFAEGLLYSKKDMDAVWACIHVFWFLWVALDRCLQQGCLDCGVHPMEAVG